MREDGFEPSINQTSLGSKGIRVQMGTLNGKWAYRLIIQSTFTKQIVYENVKGNNLNFKEVVNWILIKK
jgi:uncharacterized membrane protein